MGENAMYRGQRIKIGTCEDMYYLRWDQAEKVSRVEGSVSPLVDRLHLRFRFPWPNEDHVAPGEFECHDRSVGISCVVPEGVEHHNVQFASSYPGPGYLLSLPCPEGPAGVPFLPDDKCSSRWMPQLKIKVAKNGWGGDVKIVQQKWIKGEDGHERLCTICACGGCGAKFRLETYEAALPIIEACRKQGDGRYPNWERDAFWDKVAVRIAAGYEVTR